MKNQRHEVILDLIKNQVCVTQDELQEKLNEMGFKVTQSTVSRDIKQLRIIKALDSMGNYRYMAPAPLSPMATKTHTGQQYTDMFRNSVVTTENAYNDVVVKCYSGMASTACVAIDHLFYDKIVGSLAGDDTVLLITKSPETATELTNSLNNLLRKG